MLQKLVGSDPDSEVSRAAAEAWVRIARRREIKCLARKLLRAEDRFERWLYLDALLEFADPGDEFTGWPAEGFLIGEALTPLQREFRSRRLRERRNRQS